MYPTTGILFFIVRPDFTLLGSAILVVLILFLVIFKIICFLRNLFCFWFNELSLLMKLSCKFSFLKLLYWELFTVLIIDRLVMINFVDTLRKIIKRNSVIYWLVVWLLGSLCLLSNWLHLLQLKVLQRDQNRFKFNFLWLLEYLLDFLLLLLLFFYFLSSIFTAYFYFFFLLYRMILIIYLLRLLCISKSIVIQLLDLRLCLPLRRNLERIFIIHIIGGIYICITWVSIFLGI